jgi:O-methyltransferase
MRPGHAIRPGPRLRAAIGRRMPYRVTRIATPGRLARTHPDLEPDFSTVYDRSVGFTMTSPERMYAVWTAVRHICRRQIAGDIVECGVWRGGSSMVAAFALQQEGDRQRRLWLYDTFEGMNEPTDRDVAIDGVRAREHWDALRGSPGDHRLSFASLEDVRRNMESTGIGSQRVEYVAGPVEETVPSRMPERISLLRLDTDWYKSTRHELEHLWGRLEPGGVLIVDDYGHWKGAREAVDEFFAQRPDAPLLARTDYTGRMAVKR